jgi:hypothetical protein
VQADSGQTGYAPVSDLGAPGKKHRTLHPVSTSDAPPAPADLDAQAAPPPTTSSVQVATLAGSNAARRDDFAQSVAVSQKAVASGFEVAG